MNWKVPKKIKIYEAIGCVEDGRVFVYKNKGKVKSSSKNKTYNIMYDPKSNSIMSNDNSSYYTEYLGYPAIAFLLKVNELKYSKKFGEYVKDIFWKEIYVKHDQNKGKGVPNYDYNAVKKEIEDIIIKRGVDIEEFRKYVEKIEYDLKSKKLNLLGEKQKPPKGF
ncbi:MAG: hypothetical protein ACMXX7_00015 [Candidatus Woesearchaeota archaeon]